MCARAFEFERVKGVANARDSGETRRKSAPGRNSWSSARFSVHIFIDLKSLKYEDEEPWVSIVMDYNRQTGGNSQATTPVLARQTSMDDANIGQLATGTTRRRVNLRSTSCWNSGEKLIPNAVAPGA